MMPDEGRKAPKEDGSGSAKAHAQEPTVRKGYEDAQGPEKQGDGDPGTDPVTEPSPQKPAGPGA